MRRRPPLQGEPCSPVLLDVFCRGLRRGTPNVQTNAMISIISQGTDTVVLPHGGHAACSTLRVFLAKADVYSTRSLAQQAQHGAAMPENV